MLEYDQLMLLWTNGQLRKKGDRSIENDVGKIKKNVWNIMFESYRYTNRKFTDFKKSKKGTNGQ